MAEVLSQSEIEALLASMSGTDEETGPGEAVEQRRAALGAVATAAPQVHAAEGRVFLPLHKRRRAAAEVALLAAPSTGRVSAGCRRPMSRMTSGGPINCPKTMSAPLQLLHENFAGFFVSSLAGYLRTQVEIDLVSVEQVPYDEYMKTISTSLLNILNVDALGGAGDF